MIELYNGKGELVPRAKTNLHHVIFERRNYRDALGKMYRNMGGMVLRMEIEVHKDLHFFVPPPVRPSRDLMYLMVGNHMDTEEPLERLEGHIEYLEGLVEDDAHYSNEASKLVKNFSDQMMFLSSGYVRQKLV